MKFQKYNLTEDSGSEKENMSMKIRVYSRPIVQ